MEYICISEDEVRKKIEESELELNECFEMLIDFRYGRNDLGNVILNFQPLLAECLFDLMAFYQKLQKEKDTLISLKGNYDKTTFSCVMKTNAQYSKVISKIIEIGKNLGDAFAWFFYRDNRKELEKHFEHEATGLYVGGIGGKGELEFIKNCKNVDGLYVLYHGITNMLRIGDFSLFDTKNGIIGIGELKTKKVDDKLQVTATITSKGEVRMPKTTKEQTENFEEKIKSIRKDFPKIEKQLSTHEDLLKAKEADRSAEFYSSYEYNMFDKISQQSPFAVNSDKSLLIFASWNMNESLYDILVDNENITDWSSEEFQKRAKLLVENENIYNSFYVGELNTKVALLSIPILWWDINEKICKEIYFKKVLVITIFNPAKLLQCFIDDGFQVEKLDKLDKINIYKDINEHRISMEHFESLCYLITNGLMKTTDAYSCSKEVVKGIEDGVFQPDTKIDMHIRLDNFGKN